LKTTQTITLPTGQKIPVRLPKVPERDPKLFVEETCKFQIPLGTLRAKLEEGLWPNPSGTNPTTWDGDEKTWRKAMREKAKEQRAIRCRLIKDIQISRRILGAIPKDQWEALNRIFCVERRFQ
jgi:hypothetical protein